MSRFSLVASVLLCRVIETSEVSDFSLLCG